MLILNTLACVIAPLDTLEKVLLTKDLKYVNFLMHSLAITNSVIWTLYHYNLKNYTLSLANYAGFACEATMFMGCLYALGIISEKNIITKFCKLWVSEFYIRPKVLFNQEKISLIGLNGK